MDSPINETKPNQMLVIYFQELFKNPSPKNIEILIESILQAKENTVKQSARENQTIISELLKKVDNLQAEIAQKNDEIVNLNSSFNILNQRYAKLIKTSHESMTVMKEEYDKLRNNHDELKNKLSSIKKMTQTISDDIYSSQPSIQRTFAKRFSK